MASITIDKLVKEKFDNICNKAIQDAENEYQKTYLPQLNGKSLFEQINILKEANEQLKTRADAVKIQPYVKNHSSEEWLLKLFSSRSIILNVDDSDNLYSGIYLGTLLQTLNKNYYDLIKSIPPYTYDSFIQGVNDPFFFELEFHSHLSVDDYYKIREWQTDKLIKIVTIESGILIEKLQKLWQNENDPIEIIKSYFAHFNKTFKNIEYKSPSELISALKKFTFLNDYDFSLLDNDTVIEDVNFFIHDSINWKRITPIYIEDLRQKHSNCKQSKAFSGSPVIFFSINRTFAWIKKIIDGQNILDTEIAIDHDQIFKQTIENSLKKAENLINEFSRKNNLKSCKKDEKKNLYLGLLDNLRQEYNEDGLFKYYFAALNNERELKLIFKTNCFFSNNIPSNIDKLSKAFVLRSNMHHYLTLLYELTGDRTIPHPDKSGNIMEVMYLMHNMVLDTDLYNRLDDLMNKFMENFQFYGLPFELVRWNIYEGMSDLFNDTIERLLNYLEDCPESNKVLYIQSRLKQLKQRELEFKRFEDNDIYKDTGSYTKLFMEYLEIEADFIRETKDIQFTPESPGKINLTPNNQSSFIAPAIGHSLHKHEPKKDIPVAYTYKYYDTNQSAITNLLDNLIKNKFVAHDTSLKDFRSIFTNKPPSKPIVWLGNITELSHFIKLIHLKYKYIEPLGKDIWKVTANIFVSINNVPFQWEHFRTQKKPASSKMLESAASQLK